MGSKSIAHEAEGQISYWLRGHEGERNNCFSKIQLVGKNIEIKQLLLAKRDSATIIFVFKAIAFRQQWALTYSLVVAQPIRTRIHNDH